MTDKRTVVLVVGMHRSGTSYVSSLCQACGLQHSRAQMAENVWNRPGYFEAIETVRAHGALMNELNRPWWDIAPWPQNWQEHAAARACTTRLSEFMNSLPHGDVVVKDPRASLILPLWREVCRMSGFRLTLLICIRSAGEVAASLLKRDHINALLGVALWWRHIDAICGELSRAPLPHAFVFFPQVIGDPAQVHSLLQGLGAKVGSQGLCNNIANPSLYHQQKAPADIAQHPFLSVCETIRRRIEDDPKVTLDAPRLPGSDWMQKFMTWYPHWRSLYLRHDELLSRTRAIYNILNKTEAIGGPTD